MAFGILSMTPDSSKVCGYLIVDNPEVDTFFPFSAHSWPDDVFFVDDWLLLFFCFGCFPCCRSGRLLQDVSGWRGDVRVAGRRNVPAFFDAARLWSHISALAPFPYTSSSSSSSSSNQRLLPRRLHPPVLEPVLSSHLFARSKRLTKRISNKSYVAVYRYSRVYRSSGGEGFFLCYCVGSFRFRFGFVSLVFVSFLLLFFTLPWVLRNIRLDRPMRGVFIRSIPRSLQQHCFFSLVMKYYYFYLSIHFFSRSIQTKLRAWSHTRCTQRPHPRKPRPLPPRPHPRFHRSF